MPKVVDRLVETVHKLKKKDDNNKDKEKQKKDIWETKKHHEELQSK